VRLARLPALTIALVFVLAWTLIYELAVLTHAVPLDGLAFGRPAHLITDAAAGVLCAIAALRQQGGARLAWLLVAAGILAWTAGDSYWTFVLLDDPHIPVPSPADVGYLVFPLLAFGGLIGLLRSQVRGMPGSAWLDAVTAGLAVSAVAAAAIVPTVFHNADGGSLAVDTNLAYPITDLIMLSVVVAAVAARGWRLNGAWALAGLGIVAFWVADSHYLVTVDSYSFPDPFDTGWGLCFWFLAASAALPSTTAVARSQLGRRVAMLPLAFAGVSLGVLVYAGLNTTTPLAVALASASLVASGARLWLAFRENGAMLDASRREALTDALTGLRNRRALVADLEDAVAIATRRHQQALLLFDLDGFKNYNDTYGHGAGDELLARLGDDLRERAGDRGHAYRMGGDEFCVLVRVGATDIDEVARVAAEGLAAIGDGFEISASYGTVVIPTEASDAATALQLADTRMYERKNGSRSSAGSQSRDVLLTALAERDPDLGEHVSTVSGLAVAVAERMELLPEQIMEVRHAADLHDIGKVGIPDAILDKPGPLTDEEWMFMRRHTLIGERIVAAAPALTNVAVLVRASHERWDGRGYPDQLTGDEIPLGARIIAVCDSFDAMTATRPYRDAASPQAAIRELERCAGSQFDPAVVAAFKAAHAELTVARPLRQAA
jgi:two-component system, cell cycle response regulator